MVGRVDRGAVPHEMRDTPFTIAHDVWISEGTLLHELLRDRLEGDACPVNSRHHQAVRKVGRDLIVSATAPDGVVEAVETFCNRHGWEVVGLTSERGNEVDRRGNPSFALRRRGLGWPRTAPRPSWWQFWLSRRAA